MKNRLPVLLAFLVIVPLVAACAAPTPTPAPTSTATAVPPTPTAAATAAPTTTNTPPPATATAVPTMGAQATAPPTEGNPEAILILQPGPGSRVSSPIRVSGVANPTFEQTLAVRVLSPEGQQLALQTAQINADVGQRGPFTTDVAVPAGAQDQVFIQVYATSARDGGITHLETVVVSMVPTGQAQILQAQAHEEDIRIQQPSPGASISGGTVHVEGFGLASFEQTLVIELVDADGNSITSVPIIVNAPDIGQPGSFSADLAYPTTAAGPARVVVHDPSAAFEGDVHVSSVEITLQP